MDTDRKVVTILMAKKLRDMLDEFVQENTELALAHLGPERAIAELKKEQKT